MEDQFVNHFEEYVMDMREVNMALNESEKHSTLNTSDSGSNINEMERSEKVEFIAKHNRILSQLDLNTLRFDQSSSIKENQQKEKNEHEREKEKLLREVGKLENELEDANEEIEELKIRNNEIQTNVLKSKSKAIKFEEIALETNLLKLNNEKLTLEIHDLKQKEIELEKLKKSLKSDVDKNKKEGKKNNRVLQEMEAKLKKLRKELKEKGSIITKLMGEVALQKKDKVNLTKKVKRGEEKLKKSEAKLKEEKKRKSKKMDKKTEILKKEIEREDAMKKIKEKLEGFKFKIKEMKNIINKKNKIIDEKVKSLESLKETIYKEKIEKVEDSKRVEKKTQIKHEDIKNNEVMEEIRGFKNNYLNVLVHLGFWLIFAMISHAILVESYQDSSILPSKARGIYNRIGSLLDYQFYEFEPIDLLLQNLPFEKNNMEVLEIGCGTGSTAKNLLERYGNKIKKIDLIDISPKMIALTKDKMKEMTKVEIDVVLMNLFNESEFKENLKFKKYDVVYSTYVFDLFPNHLIEEAMEMIHNKLLYRSGVLGVVGITRGDDFISNVVSSIWEFWYRFFPSLLGGCRPLEFKKFVNERNWKIDFYERRTPYKMLTSEIIVLNKK